MKVEIVRWVCDGCGLIHEEPARGASELPPGWSGWTATDWRRHMKPDLPAGIVETSVMLQVHSPECAKLAFGQFVDRSIAEWFERGASSSVVVPA